MIDVIIRRHLSEPGLPLNGHLRGIVDSGETDINLVDIFVAFDDDVNSKPKYAGSVVPGEELPHSIDLNERPIRIRAVGRTSDGRTHVTDLKEATQTVYTPTALDKTVATSLNSLFNFTFPGTTQLATLATVVNDGVDFYNYLMPAGTLQEGDSVFVEFAFELLNNGSQKIHTVMFFGTSLGVLNTTKSGSGWTRSTFQVQAAGTIKYSTLTVIEDAMTGLSEVLLNETGEITGLDLENDEYTWGYTAVDLITAGDSTVIMGNAFKVPQPSEDDTVYLVDDTTGYFIFTDDLASALIPE